MKYVTNVVSTKKMQNDNKRVCLDNECEVEDLGQKRRGLEADVVIKEGTCLQYFRTAVRAHHSTPRTQALQRRGVFILSLLLLFWDVWDSRMTIIQCFNPCTYYQTSLPRDINQTLTKSYSIALSSCGSRTWAN
jgi:hypothetical protein